LEAEPKKVVLIADDEESDRALLALMLEKVGVANPIAFVTDGRQAIQYLKGDPPFADRTQHSFPAAMFLDLKMPVVNGWGVLDWVKGMSLKGKMRIFAYSELSNVAEVKRIYNSGADSFLKKPASGSDLRSLIQHFAEPWEMKSGFAS
jgi:CheY-like chemotaxis protein